MENTRVTLCGSTKFKNQFQQINKILTLQGYIVYSVAFFGHSDDIKLSKSDKDKLDKVHKKKIDNSDSILVIDVDGYIGESTKSEIEYAKSKGKVVRYASEFPDLQYVMDRAYIKDQTTQLREENERLRKGFELAKKYIDESPCDPDIYSDQLKAWNDYQSFLKEIEQQ